MAFNFMEDKNKKPTFTNETIASSTESYAAENRSLSDMESAFSSLAPNFQSQRGNSIRNFMPQQEPRAGDTAPATTSIDDEMLMNHRINNSDMFDDGNQSNTNYFMGGKAESVSSASSFWGEGPGIGCSAAKNSEMVDTFDFLVKSLSFANNFVSILTREQLSVLRAIRPSILYQFLQEIAKVRSDKRTRRAAPNECAFCKNNGESEECYSTHALKDWRGFVLCPVLRAFRCPRCGATGDHAHTIKYCPENADSGLERSGSFGSRRRTPPPSSSTSLIFGSQQPSAPPTPSPSPTGAMPQPSLWNNFGMN